MIKSTILAIGALLLTPPIANANIFDVFDKIPQANIDNAIESTTQFLIKRWNDDGGLKERPPQVLPIAKGSKVYGACGDYIKGDDVAGSYYCPPTRTIVLVPEQLRWFENEFGASAVAYVVAHEFAHAVQHANVFNIYGASRELQADCLAGVFIKEGSEELGITRTDVIAMGKAAHAIGSESHGTGPQRAYALASGMGITKTSCTSKEMQKLADGEIQDPILTKLGLERSGAGGVDTTKTPYPKTIKSSLGI